MIQILDYQPLIAGNLISVKYRMCFTKAKVAGSGNEGKFLCFDFAIDFMETWKE